MSTHLKATSRTSTPASAKTLEELRNALTGHTEHDLILRHETEVIGRGYHVTEIKAGTFVTLDCGSNPDKWSETIFQVEDSPLHDGAAQMTGGKFLAILKKTAEMLPLDKLSRVTFEVGPFGSAMRVFDVIDVQNEGKDVAVVLAPRSALCKPRHMQDVANAGSACCGKSTAAGAECCAPKLEKTCCA